MSHLEHGLICGLLFQVQDRQHFGKEDAALTTSSHLQDLSHSDSCTRNDCSGKAGEHAKKTEFTHRE